MNLFDATTFAKMQAGSYFVNTARETLVDEDALDAALESGTWPGPPSTWCDRAARPVDTDFCVTPTSS